MYLLEENPAKFEMLEPLAFLKRSSNNKNKMGSDMKSVPDPKISILTLWI